MARGSVYRRCGCSELDPSTGKRKQLGRSCPKLKRANGQWANHGAWAFTLSLTLHTGERRQVSRSGFDTRDEAEKVMDDLRAQAANGIRVDKRITTGDFLTRWIDSKHDVKANTAAHYRRYIEKIFIPHLGSVALADLRAHHITAMLQEVNTSAQNRRTSSTGNATTQRVRAVLRSALSDAVREGYISTNSAALVKMPTATRTKALVWTRAREDEWRAEVQRLINEGSTPSLARRKAKRPSSVMVWRGDHLGTFLDHVEQHRLYALFYVAAHTGMRRGEVCGLRWADVDMDAGTITIERQLVNVVGKVQEDSPKSSASGRVVAIGKEGVEVLKAHRARTNADRLAWGPAYSHTSRVFVREDGTDLDPSWLLKEFQRQAFKADLPPVRFHDLRHAAASLMLASGSSMKVVSTVLGHSSTAITSDVYTSVYDDASAAAVDAMRTLIPRNQAR